MKRIFTAFLICLLCGVVARSASNDTIISLITCGPGTEIYELEGHTALRIKTPSYDVAVNYGLFDFAKPGFVYRFVKGETDYMCGAIDYQLFVDSYHAQGRSVEEDVLALTSDQKQKVMQLVGNDLLPENCTYRYNYVKNNCATRPLGVILKSLGDKVEYTPDASPTTFRSEMRRYHTLYPWYQFGIDLALGSGIDYDLSGYETGFAPVRLAEIVRTMKVDGKPLVSATHVISDGAGVEALQSPTPWIAQPTTIFWALALLTFYHLWRRYKKGCRCAPWVVAAWFGAIGLTGCLMAFLVFVSEHEATSPNWLLMGINPLALIAAVCVWIKLLQKVVKWYFYLNLGLLGAMMIVWPFTGQSMNWAMVPIFLADAAISLTWVITPAKTSSDKK